MPRRHRHARRTTSTVPRPERLEARRLLAVDVLAPLADVVIDRDAAPRTIELGSAFDLRGVTGTVVRFSTNAPLDDKDVFAELFDQPGEGRTRTTPLTVANFLAYANTGRYTNTIIHRSVPGFVVQGGGFRLTSSGSDLVEAIEQFPAVLNEPGNTNARGTLAMAKLDGDPNSATNQFFVNLADNAGNLDNQNGGFTAFGRVLGNGMDLVDTVASLPRYNFGAPFTALPAIGLDNPADIAQENLVTITSVSRIGELVYSVSSSEPALATVSLTDGDNLVLALAAGATGTATVTVRAASVFDAADFIEESFTVTVVPPAATEVNALVGVAARELLISRSNGSALVTGPAVALPDEGGWREVVRGDFDGDGRSDVALLSAVGNWWVALTPAAGPAPAPELWSDLRASVPWQFPSVGDFTGDGRDDIAVWNPAAGTWRVLASTGTGFDKQTFGNWNPAVEWTVPLVGDFDGDGKADLASRAVQTGAWHVARSSGTAFTTEIWRRQRTTITWDFLTAADFNGDGLTDIATWNTRSGAWRVLTSTGSGFTNSRFTVWNPATGWTDVVAADFDGDGRSDLVARDPGTGQLHVARSEATSFTTTAWGQFDTTVAWQFITPGDFDGDGRSDLAVRNQASGAWWLLASTGTGFVGSGFGSWPTTTTWTAARGLRV
ncbi:MAG: peptidylprolyl isomerase [Planctomycetota bacterium]